MCIHDWAKASFSTTYGTTVATCLKCGTVGCFCAGCNYRRRQDDRADPQASEGT